MSASFIDRSSAAYQMENAHLLREVVALETRVEQLILSNHSFAEALFAAEGAGLRTLLQLTNLARAELAQPGAKSKKA